MGNESGGALQLKDQIHLHKRGWVIKRIAWAVFALIIATALGGLLGPGPASKAIAGEQNSPLWVEYNRFNRYQAPTELKIHFKAPGKEEVHIWMDRQLADNFQVQQFDPQPFKMYTTPDRVYLLILQEKESSGGKVVLDIEPTKFWRNKGRIGLRDGPTVEVNQLYYP